MLTLKLYEAMFYRKMWLIFPEFTHQHFCGGGIGVKCKHFNNDAYMLIRQIKSFWSHFVYSILSKTLFTFFQQISENHFFNVKIYILHKASYVSHLKSFFENTNIPS